MKYVLAILFTVTLAGCPAAHVHDPSGYRTRMLCVDYEDHVVDVEWVEPSRVAGEPDRCGTVRIDYMRWAKMTEDEVFSEIARSIRDSDTRFGASCAKKGR